MGVVGQEVGAGYGVSRLSIVYLSSGLLQQHWCSHTMREVQVAGMGMSRVKDCC